MGWAARLNPRSRHYNKPMGMPWYKCRQVQTVKEPTNVLAYEQHPKVGVKMSLLESIKDFLWVRRHGVRPYGRRDPEGCGVRSAARIAQ